MNSLALILLGVWEAPRSGRSDVCQCRSDAAPKSASFYVNHSRPRNANFGEGLFEVTRVNPAAKSRNVKVVSGVGAGLAAATANLVQQSHDELRD